MTRYTITKTDRHYVVLEITSRGIETLKPVFLTKTTAKNYLKDIKCQAISKQEPRLESPMAS